MLSRKIGERNSRYGPADMKRQRRHQTLVLVNLVMTVMLGHHLSHGFTQTTQSQRIRPSKRIKHLSHGKSTSENTICLRLQDTTLFALSPEQEQNDSNHSSNSRTRHRKDWLEQATQRLVSSEVGSLDMGKWHEVVSIFTAWNNLARHDAQAPFRMEALLKRLLLEPGVEEQKQGTRGVVTIDLYNRLLEAWCAVGLKCKNKAAVQRAREILVLLENQPSQPPQTRPNRYSFSVVLSAVCRLEGPLEGRRMLAWMEYLSIRSGRNKNARPRPRDYRILLDTYALAKTPNAGRLAEGVLRHMKAVGVPPDTICYNLAIKAWAKSRRGRASAEHADQLFEQMKQQEKESLESSSLSSSERTICSAPDLVTYGSVISAWAGSGMRAHAVARAEELLEDLKERFEPNTVVINTVMSTWVKSKNPGAVKRTRELLQQMEEGTTAPPDLYSYNTHLHALSIHSSTRRPEYAKQAEELLTRMEQRADSGESDCKPNLFSYNLVLDAYCRCHEYLPAAGILRRLIQRPGVEPDTFSFNQVLTALSKSHGIKVDNTTDSSQMSSELLRYMEDAYETGLHPRARPDVLSYGAVLYGYARSGHRDAASRAETLLQEMKERVAAGQSRLKPNRKCYNAVIAAWASQGTLVGARKAEEYLQEMQNLYDAGDASMAPDLVTYNTVLNAWAKSGTRCCGRKAELYLNRMWELYKAGDESVKPNDFSYNTVINAISKSKNEGKAQKALRILRQMDKLYQAGNKETRPNEMTYTAVLNSCAFPAVLDPRTRRKALDTAIFTLAELRASRYGQPNHVTYGTFILACANLLPRNDEMRRQVLEQAFHQCCTDGQVNEMVLANLRRAAPPDLFHELLPESVHSGRQAVSIEDLPPEWRANVRDRRKTGPWRGKHSNHIARTERLKP